MPRINPYILQQQKTAERLALASTIQRVPPELQPKQLNSYPEDNKYEFERWLKDNLKPQELVGKDRTYLPVLWTGYWCNNGYGTKDRARKVIQRFVDSLPRNKAYFSICQYDDGPMVDFKDLNIKIFGMSGGRIDYPIPLLCCPHKFEFPNIKKDIFCSFVGADTHPIRRELIKEFEGKPDCYVTMKKHSLEDYCKILARSVFALAPRGYGPNSFRVQESIQQGAVPVYISDDHVICPDTEDMMLVSESAHGIAESLNMLKYKLPELRHAIESKKHLFTYEGCKQKILENI